MTPRPPSFVGLLPVALALGCGSSVGKSLDVGSDDGSPSFVTDDAGGPGALDAYIEQGHVAVKFITLSCSGDCAAVEAVGTGGYPPYAFKWDDGSTNAIRQVCPTTSTSYDVKVTDTGTSGELARAPETVQLPLAANVIACPDGGAANAPDVYWATWTQMQTGTPGTAGGFFAPPTGNIQVSYSGEVGPDSEPAGTAAISFLPASTYLSATVGNAPPATGMVVLDGSANLTQTITFSAPVLDPLVAVMSLGDFANSSRMVLAFDAAPVLLSSGGDMVGPLTLPGMLSVSGQSLTGIEGSGVVQFSGTFTSITFTVPTAEVGGYANLTLGIRGPG